MCGIAGSWIPAESLINLEQEKNDVLEMLEQIKNRGPDSKGLFISEEHKLILGHRRLKIIDTSNNANQPMESKNKRYLIVYNGEIYNFREIKDDLENKGVTFTTSGDTEVLLEAYSAYGHRAWNLLDGMFSVAIYDKLEKKLILARDRFGEKPLYYLINQAGLVFGSELKPLIKKKGKSSKIGLDKESLALYFFLRYVPSPRSIIEGIKKLEAGTYIEVMSNLSKRKVKWATTELTPWEGELTQKIFLSTCDSVEEALLKSIKKRLISDVPLGLFLSGGVDSALIATLCSRVLNISLSTYTYGASQDPKSEIEAAIYLSNSLGHRPHEKIVDSDEIIRFASGCGEAIDEPLGDRSLITQRIISQFAKNDVTVCLSGDGGDELFGGYDRYHKFSLKNSHFANNFEKSFAYEYFTKGLPVVEIDNLMKAFPSEGRAIKDVIQSNYKHSLIPDTTNASIHTMRSIDLQSYLSECVLTKVDRATMGYSLESRSPFLNSDVFSICSKLPKRACVNNNKLEGKLILRQILSKYMTESEKKTILCRKKQGFGVSNELFRDNKNFIKKQFKEAFVSVHDLNIFEQSELRYLVEGMKNNNAVWSFIVFGQWLKSLNKI